MSDQKLLEATTMELLLEHEFTSQDELADWLNLRDWPEISEFDPDADNLPAIGAPGYVCTILDDFPEELTEVYNLDPVTGAALLTGLAALLQYVSNKSDAKKARQNQPPNPPVSEKPFAPYQELCAHLEDKKLCARPFNKTIQIRGDDYLVIIRFCTKKPKAHRTVEYYRLP